MEVQGQGQEHEADGPRADEPLPLVRRLYVARRVPRVEVVRRPLRVFPQRGARQPSSFSPGDGPGASGAVWKEACQDEGERPRGRERSAFVDVGLIFVYHRVICHVR